MRTNITEPPPPAASKSPVAAHAAPVGRPPRWLLLLFPGLGDLSQNPLYIRLSGQGYRRRGWRGYLSGPADFRGASSAALILNTLSFLPLLSFGLGTVTPEAAFIISIPVSFVIFLRFLAGTRHPISIFFQRANRDGWWEDLTLAGFDPATLRRAIFAAVLPKQILTILLPTGIVAAIIAYGIAIQPGFHWTSRQAFHDLGLTFCYWLLVFGFYSGLEAYEIGRRLRRGGLGSPESTGAAYAGCFTDAIALGLLLFGPYIIAMIIVAFGLIPFAGFLFVAVSLAIFNSCVRDDVFGSHTPPVEK